MAAETIHPKSIHRPQTIRATPDESSLQDPDAEIKHLKRLTDQEPGPRAHSVAVSVTREVALKREPNSIQSPSTNLLIQCPNLVEFKLHKSKADTHDTTSDLALTLGSELIVWDKIEMFHWGEYKHRINYKFLQSIRLPALRTLVWTLYPGGPDREISITDSHTFFKNLPPTLTTLRLRIDPYFRHANNITDIQPLLYNANINHLLLDSLSYIGLQSILEGLSGEGVFPGLTKLTIYDWEDDKNIDLLPRERSRCGCVITTPIIRFLARLFWAQKTRQFCIETEGFEVEWLDSEKDVLKRLVDSGMKLGIIEDSQPVKWLPIYSGATHRPARGTTFRPLRMPGVFLS